MTMRADRLPRTRKPVTTVSTIIFFLGLFATFEHGTFAAPAGTAKTSGPVPLTTIVAGVRQTATATPVTSNATTSRFGVARTEINSILDVTDAPSVQSTDVAGTLGGLSSTLTAASTKGGTDAGIGTSNNASGSNSVQRTSKLANGKSSLATSTQVQEVSAASSSTSSTATSATLQEPPSAQQAQSTAKTVVAAAETSDTNAPTADTQLVTSVGSIDTNAVSAVAVSTTAFSPDPTLPPVLAAGDDDGGSGVAPSTPPPSPPSASASPSSSFAPPPSSFSLSSSSSSAASPPQPPPIQPQITSAPDAPSSSTADASSVSYDVLTTGTAVQQNDDGVMATVFQVTTVHRTPTSVVADPTNNAAGERGRDGDAKIAGNIAAGIAGAAAFYVMLTVGVAF